MTVGRNDPCPCGSGKKYKKCCARKDDLDKRVAERTHQVDELIDPDATVYRVWTEWRKAKERSEFQFMVDLVAEDSPLAARFPDRHAFLQACDEGTDLLPAGEPAAFRHLRIVDGITAHLLQTTGHSDPARSTLRCECLTFRRTDGGWRLWDLQSRDLPKSDEVPVSFDLFDVNETAAKTPEKP